MKQFFSTGFQKNTQISNFMKIHLVGAELFHMDARTDMTKLIAALCNLTEAPKNQSFPLSAVSLSFVLYAYTTNISDLPKE
jgi:hypothetical protein